MKPAFVTALFITALFIAAALGAQSARAEGVLVAEPDPCAGLTRHSPAPDVAYEPGIDAAGEPVPPAELDEGARLALPPSYHLDLFVRLDELIEIDPDSNLAPVVDSELSVGKVTIEGDDVSFNGQPLASQADNELARACRERQEAERE